MYLRLFVEIFFITTKIVLLFSCIFAFFYLSLHDIFIGTIMQNTEIERKFLVKDDSYKVLATRHFDICQGYIAKGNGRTVRVRIRDKQAFLTIKTAPQPSAIAHFEWEKEIPLQDGMELLKRCLPGLIEKRRWIVPNGIVDGHEQVWEVDEFIGRLEGRTLAEIELESEDESFDIPAFIGEEVTGQKQYYNANM